MPVNEPRHIVGQRCEYHLYIIEILLKAIEVYAAPFRRPVAAQIEREDCEPAQDEEIANMLVAATVLPQTVNDKEISSMIFT